MEVELGGQAALVVGPDGSLRLAVTAALERNGARVAVLHDGGQAAAATVRRALEALGRLDMLVVISPTALGDSAADAAPASQAARFADYCRAAAALLAAHGGRVVAIGSVLGLVAARADAERGAADAALFSLVRTEAQRLGAAGTRVNGLALGDVEDSGCTAAPRASGPQLLSHIPLGRSATLAEVADSVLFLCDPENSYLNGHILAVDGGFSAGFARDF